ncbi:hypothetical protein NDU88_011701 [Pleurodeles waltl]|uniref:Uncharacterized protein n=1 Tax=Pleurodeles waltl TaxID=8319 RepID=A0AAV7R2F7_PLEWA|nr:hypothetical protein NDU88_011701 [Pleurodeles waltl]
MTDAPGLSTLLRKRGWKLRGAPPAPLTELWIPPGHFPSISRGRFNLDGLRPLELSSVFFSRHSCSFRSLPPTSRDPLYF